MITDQPATTKAGHFSLNLAWIWNHSSENDTYEVPHFDINYGLTERAQIKAETGWVTVGLAESNRTFSGMNSAVLGLKYRIVDESEGRWAVSTFPQAGFRYFLSSKNVRVSEPGTHYYLPLLFVRHYGRFGINPEIGFDHVIGNPDALFLSTALSYEYDKGSELLAEIHSRNRGNSDGAEVILNLGTRYLINERESLLLAAGRTLVTYKGEPVFYLVYLGLQLNI